MNGRKSSLAHREKNTCTLKLPLILKKIVYLLPSLCRFKTPLNQIQKLSSALKLAIAQRKCLVHDGLYSDCVDNSNSQFLMDNMLNHKIQNH